MKRHKKICSMIGLSLLLFTLGGCDSTKTTVEEVMEEMKTTEEGKPEDATLELEDVILQVGDTPVTYREVLFYIYQVKQRYEEQLSGAVWDVVLKDETSFEDFAKEEILRNLTEVKVIYEEAKRQEVQLTDAEKSEAENQATTFLNTVSEEEKETFGFTQEILNTIFIENALADKMYQHAKNSVQLKLDEEAYREVTIQYLQVMTDGTDKTGKTISMTEKQKAKAKKRANTLLEKAKEAEDFEAFAKEKSSLSQVSLTFGKEDMPKTIGEVSMALKTGEFSDVIEGEDGYYIVYCVTDRAESTDTKINEAIEKFQDENFERQYTSWSEQCNIEVSVNLWKLISVKEL